MMLVETPSQNSVSGVSPGASSAQAHPPGTAAAPISRPAGGLVAKPLFGGNVGKRVRADGFKAGSPEALEADRRKDRERKRQARRDRAAQTPPPPLPSSGNAPAPAQITDPLVSSGDGVAGEPVSPVVLWQPEDLKQAAAELIELGEAQRVSAICKKCVDARLPDPVTDEFRKDAAFPAATKKSLSSSLPGTLASAFNAMRVPIALKSVISAVPALSYLILRDFQLNAKLDKIIAADAPEKPAAK